MSELPESHIGEDIQSTPDTEASDSEPRAIYSRFGRRHKPKQYPDYVLWSHVVVQGQAVERDKAILSIKRKGD